MTAQQTLQHYFGYESFRQGQDSLIQAILQGRDVLGIMPTGAGKSICYQVPALMLSGLCIVISPLISLMQDQVEQLVSNGVPAVYLNSSLSEEELRQTLGKIYRGEVKLLYTAPERLDTPSMQQIGEQIPISMLMVDEAHCVSQWGQDFRPSYLQIPHFLTTLPRRPIVGAFTATATKQVSADIAQLLGLQDYYSLTTGFDRPNLYFEIQKQQNKQSTLFSLLQSHKEQSGIIYCISRRLVEEVCESLCLAGYPATRYHAGLTPEERTANQEDFLYDRKLIMVATNAFGMGIDKSNVGYVIHYNMPRNLESYYQEAGRAGRDGTRADCILLYHGKDVKTHEFLIENGSENDNIDPTTREELKVREYARLKRMTFYSTHTKCLRQFMLQYFGERASDYCGNCSVCRQNFVEKDMTLEAQKIVSCVYRLERLGRRASATALCSLLKGESRADYQTIESQLSTFGIMQESSLSDLQRFVKRVLDLDYLTQNKEGELQLTARSAQLLKQQQKVSIPIPREKPSEPEGKPRHSVSQGDTPEEQQLFQMLKECRLALARKERIPPFIIFPDSTLLDMCRKKPTTEHSFLAVSGVGRVKFERYGEAFMQKIREYQEVQ